MADCEKQRLHQGVELDLHNTKASLSVLSGDARQVLQQVETLRFENQRVVNPRSSAQVIKPYRSVSPDDARALVSKVFNHLNETHQRLQTKHQQCTHLELFGWQDLRYDVENSVDFAIHKTFANESAADRCLQTWRFFQDFQTAKQLMPAVARPGRPRRPPQVIDNRIVIIPGGGQDTDVATSRQGTDMLMARAESNGKWMLIMAFFDASNIANVLASSEPLDEAFSWYFEDMPAQGSNSQGPSMRLQLGGSMRNASDAMVRAMISEHVFVLIRWEMLAVRHFRITTDESNRKQVHSAV